MYLSFGARIESDTFIINSGSLIKILKRCNILALTPASIYFINCDAFCTVNDFEYGRASIFCKAPLSINSNSFAATVYPGVNMNEFPALPIHLQLFYRFYYILAIGYVSLLRSLTFSHNNTMIVKILSSIT